MKRRAAAAALALLLNAAQATSEPALRVDEPRAFGWRIGDRVARSIEIDIPPGFTLQPGSLPQPGQRGQAIELRRADWRPGGNGGRLELQYQVFFSPPAVRTLELPVLRLRLTGPQRVHELRVDAWPVTVAPLVPVDVSPRHGLGELQPDIEPPLLDGSGERLRLTLAAGLALLLLTYLAAVYLGGPWRARRGQPFECAWRSLRHLPERPGAGQWRGALSALHEALNRCAGAALFEQGLERFVSDRPRYAALRPELQHFFEQSRAAFFSDAAEPAADVLPQQRRRLLELARRLRDAERGAA